YLPAAAIWSGLAALICAASVLVLARDRRLDLRFPQLSGRRGAVLLLIAAFGLPEVLDELINGNVHMYLLGLFTVAWLGVDGRLPRVGRVNGDRIAGLAIGVATVIKLFPGVILLWFVLTGRRTAVIWTVVGALALGLVTLPITGLQAWFDFPTMLANMSAP